jgi:hypothetical protein
LGEGSKSPVPLLPAWEKGLGDEGEDLDINKSAFLSFIPFCEIECLTVKCFSHGMKILPLSL